MTTRPQRKNCFSNVPFFSDFIALLENEPESELATEDAVEGMETSNFKGID